MPSPRCQFSFPFLVSCFSFLLFDLWCVLWFQLSQFLILVHRLATAEAGQIIKFQETKKQNSVLTAEIPNSPEQIPTNA